MERHVLFHRDADGYGAAYAAWKKFGEQATYTSVQYGEPIPDILEGCKFVYVLDFCYKSEVIIALQERGIFVITLDHHKTSELDIVVSDLWEFDTNKSGAVLAWEHFHPEEKIPVILEYVQDRDLWKFELPYSEVVNLYISTLEGFKEWDDFDIIEGMATGTAIKRFQDKQIKSKLKNIEYVNFSSSPEDISYFPGIPCINLTENISEYNSLVLDTYPDLLFSASYFIKEGKKIYSLRSKGDFDVSVIAKAFGGGGHKNAAGFSRSLND
jgi:oligoribonuclease NrnB/cAMP/cGMP phosphodiesterase (DHH superfamily)